MKTLTEIKAILEDQKAFLEREYGVVEIGIFGSYVHNAQNLGSDVDILIELEDPPRIDLFDLVRLQNYLSDLLQLEVDVALKGSLRKRIGRRILDEVIIV